MESRASRASAPREKKARDAVSQDWKLAVCPSHHIVLVRALGKPPMCKGRGHRRHASVGSMSNNSWPLESITRRNKLKVHLRYGKVLTALGKEIEGIRGKGEVPPWGRRRGRVLGTGKSSPREEDTPDTRERVPMRSEKMRNTDFSNLTVRQLGGS